MRKNYKRIYNNILVDAVMHLGDLIHATTIIPLLKNTFPKAKVSFLVPSGLCELFDLIEGVDNVIPYSYKSGGDYYSVYKMAQQIKKYNFDLSISLDPRIRLSSMMWLAGIPTRVGSPSIFGWKPGFERFFFSDFIDFGDFDIKRHTAAENFQQLIRLFAGIGNVDDTNFIKPFFKEADCKSNEYIEQALYGMHEGNVKIAFCVKTVAAVRNWDAENFSEIIKKLANNYNCDFIFVGINSDKDVIDSVCNNLESVNNVFHMEGRTNFKQLNALFRKVDFLVNLDNGMGHFAAAADCPTVTIFSNVNPWKFRPLHKQTKLVFAKCDCRDNCNDERRKNCMYKCLTSIERSEVYENIISMVELVC